MYSENEERRRYPIRDFLIKLVLVVLFVLLLLWLMPTQETNLKGITDRIFNANVQTMKEAAMPYFTTERLPQKVGESKTLTLQEMIDLKLLLPFTDKEGNACDTKDSYVKVTKDDDEYIMKVNLKCGDEEAYILVYVGCYSYCEADLCEKEVTDKTGLPSGGSNSTGTGSKPKLPGTIIGTVITGPSCALQVSGGNLGSNGWYLGDVSVSFKSKATTAKGTKITQYGLTESATVSYNGSSTYKVNKDGTTKVFGYIKDSNGKTAVCSIAIKRDTVAPACKVEVLSGVKNSAGNFVSDVTVGLTSNTDRTSGVDTYGVSTNSAATYNLNKQIVLKNNGTHTVNGYVRDKAGHAKKCSVKITINKDKDKTITSVPSCSLDVKQGTLGTNNWYVSNVNVGFKTMTSTNGASIVKYGLGTSENYNKAMTTTITNEGTTTLRGYVEDSNGYKSVCSITIKKDSVKPNCSLAVQSGTYNTNGYYTSAVTTGFRTRYDATSGIREYGLGKELNYNNTNAYTVNNDASHLIYGFVKDNAGNVNLCSIKVVKKSVAYEYQYSKVIETTYGNWSNWIEKEYTQSNKPSFTTTATKEVEDLGARTTSSYKYSVGSPVVSTVNEFYKQVETKACAGFNYYLTTSSTTTSTTVQASQTYAVSTSSDSWKYVGLVSLSNPPTDTLSTKYVFVGMDWNRCNNCSITPYTTWKKYTREVGTVKNQTVNGTPEVVITRNVNGQSVTTKCSSLVTKKVDLYLQKQTVVGYSQVRETVSSTKYYYRERTRPIITNRYTDYKWANYNNSNLLNQGYKLTGNKRTVG